MRRLALLTALATLAIVAVAMAVAGPSSTLTVNPNTAGSGSKATLDVKLSKAKPNPRSLTLRVVRGVKVDPRAVAVECTLQQANANDCPKGSRVGGGSNDVTVKSTASPPSFPPFTTTITTDLYLMPPLKQGDIAGADAQFTVDSTGQKGHSLARITNIPPGQGPFGIQTKYGKIDTALTAPAGTKVHIDHMHLKYGKSRVVMVNGKAKTYNLITNPKTCNKPWVYELVIAYPTGTPSTLDGSTPCAP